MLSKTRERLRLELIDEIRHEQPRTGIMQYAYADPALPTDWMINDDQFMLQMTSIYYPQYFRSDDQRYLLAWLRVVDRPLADMRREKIGSGSTGQASILHGSSTISWASQKAWDDWIRENGLM